MKTIYVLTILRENEPPEVQKTCFWEAVEETLQSITELNDNTIIFVNEYHEKK